MEKVYVNAGRCKGCFLCVNVCPTEALTPSGELNAKGNETVEADQEKCIACGACYKVCPDCAIEVY